MKKLITSLVVATSLLSTPFFAYSQTTTVTTTRNTTVENQPVGPVQAAVGDFNTPMFLPAAFALGIGAGVIYFATSKGDNVGTTGTIR